jgi:lipopolysaccharide export system protein LptA
MDVKANQVTVGGNVVVTQGGTVLSGEAAVRRSQQEHQRNDGRPGQRQVRPGPVDHDELGQAVRRFTQN